MHFFFERNGLVIHFFDKLEFLGNTLYLYIPYLVFDNIDLDNEKAIMFCAPTIFCIIKNDCEFQFTFRFFGFGIGFKKQWGY